MNHRLPRAVLGAIQSVVFRPIFAVLIEICLKESIILAFLLLLRRIHLYLKIAIFVIEELHVA